MTTLINILADFRAGKLEQAQLFARVESLLDESGRNVDSLINDLQQQHATVPLPLSILVGLKKHLHAVAAPKTEIISGPLPVPVTTTALSKEEQAANQAIGATLAGRFKLIEYIGSGGTSRLYKAIDERKVEAGSADKHIAVKVLTYPFKDTLDGLAALNRETEGTQKLTHPNIVRVIDCDRDGDTVFMTMEFIGGKTLHSLLRTSRFLGAGRSEALAIIRDVANAIDYAHSQFIVHGDLTPGNIMIAMSGGAKVIDFGIARVFGKAAASNVSNARQSGSRGELSGFSPSYASPQTIELQEPDPRDDIYSFGCIVWELLTGAHPFDRVNAKAAQENGAKPKYNERLSKQEYAALTRALQFDRDQRTATIKQFIDELVGEKKSLRKPIVIAASVAIVAALGTWLILGREAVSPAQISQGQTIATAASRQALEPQPVPAPTPTAPAQPGSVFRDCPTCPLLTVLPSGEFMQGSDAKAPNAQVFEMPQHKVTVAKSFALTRTEITVAEFAEFAVDSGRNEQGCATYNGAWQSQTDVQWKNAIARQTPSHPVSCVSWQDVSAYAQWLSKRTGQRYRLPSASEWEFSARAGSTADRDWSIDAQACTHGNVADQSGAQRYPGWTAFACNDAYALSAPVASYAANSFGLHDMLGNVFEWVADCWSDSYEGAPTDGSARNSGDCSQHEMRGGSWFTSPSFVRYAYRNRFANEYRSTSIGFRLLRELSN